MFGSGVDLDLAEQGSGGRVGFTDSNLGYVLALSMDYSRGETIAFSSTWQDTSYAVHGINPGTYVWSWAEGSVNFDTFTLNVLPVPEPGVAALLGLGGVCLMRRRQA